MTDPKAPQSLDPPPEALGDLVHRIYDTALDNALWPELIMLIHQEISRLSSAPEDNSAALRDLQTHFTRGLHLTERIVTLQRAHDLQNRILSSLSLRVQMFDAKGGRMLSSAPPPAVPGRADTAPAPDRGVAKLPMAWKEAYRANGHPVIAQADDGTQSTDLIYGPGHVAQLGVPPGVAWVVIRMNQDPARIAANLAESYDLSASRQRLLAGFLHQADLRQAASEAGLSYESARSYMKDICRIVGVPGQTELLRTVLLNPAALVVPAEARQGSEAQRHQMTTPDGRRIEYFALGDPEAYPIVHYDALTGGALDVLGAPARYLPLLQRLGARLIIPCRPGTFRSEFLPQSGASAYAQDVSEICDHLGIERFSLLAYSYGCVAALGAASGLQQRVDRVTLASVCFPDHTDPSAHKYDFFYQISRVIGQRWPGALRGIIPFLCKSILQNIDRFSDHAADRADCAHEEALLRAPEIRARSRDMLEMRIEPGMEGLIQEYQIIGRRLDFDIGQLQVPLQLFHGSCDRINPMSGAEALAQAAPQATLVPVPERGHAFIYAEWDWLLAAAVGADYQIPSPGRRGILHAAD